MVTTTTHTLHTTTHSRQNGVDRIHGGFSSFLINWQLPVEWQFLIHTVLVGDVGVNYTQENSFVNLFSKIFAIWPDFDWK